MPSTFEKILAHVAKLLPDYVDELEPGYPADELAQQVQAVEQRIGTRLSAAYYELYERFDGDSLGLAFGWFFTSLGRALVRLPADEYGWHANPDNPDQVKPQSHSTRRLPIVEDYGGSIIYLDYDPAPGGTPGQLILIFRDDPTTIYSVAPSLDTLLELVLAEFEAGRVQAAEDGENHLEFAATEGPYEAFWSDLSNRWRSKPLAQPAESATSLAALPALWRQKIEQLDGPFDPAKLHRVRTLLVNDPAMLPDLANILLFPKLRTLDLYAHPVTAEHLALVAQTKVTSLTLAGVLPDLTPLTYLTKLRRLSLVDATVPSLAPLAALLHLEALELELVEVPNLRPLASLRNLQELTLENSTKQPGLIPVPIELPSLHVAEVEEFLKNQPVWQPRPAKWPPLAVLGPLPKLQSLDVSGTNFADLGALLAFPQLRHVSLVGCPITDFSAARELPNGLSFAGDGTFLEGILAVAPDKGFLFNSMSGDMTEAQEALWDAYLERQRANE
ncbi:MAG: SMI1/KNR4 family protein [Janthinobacterium lividum]